MAARQALRHISLLLVGAMLAVGCSGGIGDSEPVLIGIARRLGSGVPGARCPAMKLTRRTT